MGNNYCSEPNVSCVRVLKIVFLYCTVHCYNILLYYQRA